MDEGEEKQSLRNNRALRKRRIGDTVRGRDKYIEKDDVDEGEER